MKTILLLLALSTIAYSGQIWSWADIDANNNQVGSTAEVILYFNLESPLPASGYMKIALPFATSGLSISGSVSTASSRCGSLGATTIGSDNVATLTAETNSYFISFSSPLEKNTNYALKLNLGTPSTVTAAGLSGQIGLYTTTSAVANYLTIDSNPTFGDFEWVANTTTLVLSDNAVPTAEAANATNFGAAYSYNFAFTPAVDYLGGATVQISLSNKKFGLSNCTVVSIGTENVTANLPTCSAADGLATFYALNGFSGKVIMRIGVTNPTDAITTADVIVRIYRRFGDQLLESGVGSSYLQTKFTTTITGNAIRTAFNLAPSTTSGHPIRFYRGIESTADGDYYQVYKFVFKPATPLPAKFRNTLTIDLAAQAYIIPLDASLVHNLDAPNSGKPTCSVVRSTTTDAKSIQCSPVALTNATTEYFVSIKIKFTSAASSATPDAFGKLTVTVDKNADDTAPFPATEKTVINNLPIGPVNLIYMHALHNSAVATAVKKMHVDVDGTPKAQRFYWGGSTSVDIFYWMNKATYATEANIIKDVCTNAKNIGVDIYMNKYITLPASPTASIGIQAAEFAIAGTASATAWQSLPNITGVNGSNSIPYTRVRANYYSDNDLALTASADNTKFYVRLIGALITKPPSLRADEAAFEFYIGFMSNINSSSVEPYTYTDKNGFYSALIMTGPNATSTYTSAFATLGVGLVGGNSPDTTINGRWPALIRVTGTLHANESTGASKLAIFFNNLSPYAGSSAGENPVLCVASQNGTVSNTTTCNLVEGSHATADATDTTRDNVAGYSRIEVTWSAIGSTTPFQILIPVGIKTDDGKTDIHIATLDSAGIPIALGISKAGVTGPVDTSTATVYGAYTDKVQYRFKVGSTPGANEKIGGNSSLQLTFVSNTSGLTWSADTVNNYPDSGAYRVSAGLQYCASWNFYNNQTLTTNTRAFVTAGKADDRCMTYSLAVVKSAHTEMKNLIPYSDPDRWCVFCPIGSYSVLTTAQAVVNLTNYIFWTGGNKWPAKKWASPTVGCLFSGASTRGDVIECDDSYDAVTTGTISGTFNPNFITNISSNNRVGINLTLTNPFPTSDLPGMKVVSRVIYLRTNLETFTQQASTDCETDRGSCSLAFKVATPADDATGSIGDASEATGATPFQPTTITLNNPTSATSISVVLYGINPVSTASVLSATVSFTTRVVWAESATSTNKWSTQLDTNTSTTTFNVSITGSVGNLDLSGIAFTNTLRGYRGGLKIPFKLGNSRDFMRNEKIVITFNNAAFTNGANLPTNVLCEAYAAPDQFLANIKSCLVETTGITIEAQGDIKTDGAPYILLRHYTAFDAGNTSVSGALSIGGTTIQSTATPSATSPVVPSSVANGNGTVANLTATVSRVNNILGGSSILQFNITNNLGVAVGAGWRILIDFPLYYAPKLSNLKEFVIQINGVPTIGSFLDQRHLQIVVPTVTIANGSSIILRIHGVSNPRIPTASTSPFWIALDNDTNSNYIPVMGTVADAAAAVETTGMIWPYNMMFAPASSGAVTIRSSATLQIVTVTRVTLAPNQVISLDFPQSWIGLLSASTAQSVTCLATFTTINRTLPNFATIAPAATHIGVLANTIRLNVTANVTAGSQLNISCSNFRTPDGPFPSNCLAETPTIEVFDANETAPLAKSSPSVHHFDRAAFTVAYPPASLLVLTANQQTATVIQGTAQAENQFIRIADVSPFSRAITASIVTPPNGVALHLKSGAAAVGDKFLPIGFSALPTAPLGNYTLILNKVETALTTGGANAYANLPSVRLCITNDKVKITGPDAEIKIPVGGTSVPLTYSFDYTPAPNSDLTFTVSPNDTAVTVSPIPALKFGAVNLTFTLTISKTAVSGSKYLVSLVPPSGAPAFSNVPAPILVVVSDAITDSPTIIATVDTATTAATSQGLKLTIGSTSNSSTTPLGPHAVYYACALTSLALNRDLQYVQTQLSTAATTQTPPPPGETYGMDTYTAPKGGEILRVARLHASTEYTCRVWAVNQGNLNGSTTVTFKTGSNEGRVVKVNANFLNNTDFSAQKIQNLVCWLAQSFAVPSRLVRSQDGQTCSGKALWSINWNLQQIGASFAYAVPIYFLPNLMLEKDTLATAVADGLKTASWMTQVVASQATTFASAALDTIVYPNTTAPVYAAPSVTNATDNTALTFTFVPSNNSASFIHIGVYAVNGSGTPTFADLTPFVSTAADPLAYTVAYYNGSAFNAPITVNASMTTGVTYNAYWVATCDNPSESSISCSTAVQGPIQVGKGTAAPPVDAGAGSTDARILSVSFSVIVALFLSFIL